MSLSDLFNTYGSGAIACPVAASVSNHLQAFNSRQNRPHTVVMDGMTLSIKATVAPRAVAMGVPAVKITRPTGTITSNIKRDSRKDL
jgi:hypothetical protein